MGVRGDLRLLETAVRRRYEIDTEKAAETVNKHMGDSDPRVALRAAGIAVLMEGQNQKDEFADADELRKKLLELATQLGVSFSADGEIGSGPGGDRPAIANGNRQGQ